MVDNEGVALPVSDDVPYVNLIGLHVPGDDDISDDQCWLHADPTHQRWRYLNRPVLNQRSAVASATAASQPVMGLLSHPRTSSLAKPKQVGCDRQQA
jgi:hypothetical protein